MSNSGAIPALLVLLRSGNELDQIESLHSLLATEERTALVGVIEAYHHLGSSIRDELECYAERFVSIFEEMVHSPDDQIRFNCVEFLSRSRVGKTTRFLGRYVGDSNPHISALAMSALQSVVVRFITPREGELRTENSQAYANCRTLCDAIEMNSPEYNDFSGVLQALKAALETGSRVHGARIFDLIVRMGRRGDAMLLNELRVTRRRKGGELIIRELETHPRPATLSLALTLLAAGSSTMRRIALDVIQACEHGNANDDLVETLKTTNIDLTCRVVHRLKGMPWMRVCQHRLDELGEDALAAWVEALDNSGGDLAKKLSLLRRCLMIESEKVASAIFAALSRHYSPLIRPMLLELCSHPYEPIRYQAVAALSRTNFDGKHRLLKGQLSSDSARIRVLAANAIVTDQFDEFFDRFEDMNESRRQESATMVRRIDPALFSKLSERLHSRDVEERLRAMRILTYTGVDQRIEQDLIEVAHDSNSKIRACAPYVLGQLASPLAARSVMWLLKDFDIRVRANAVEGIEILGRGALGKVLVPFLGSSIARLRANAAKALYRLGSERAQQILDAMADSKHSNMRLAAVWAFSAIGEQPLIERALDTALSERNQFLQRRMMAFIDYVDERKRAQSPSEFRIVA